MKQKNHPPAIRKLKRPGGAIAAYVTVNRQRRYLGEFGSQEASEAYARIVAELAANNGHFAVPVQSISVNEVVAQYWAFAEQYYVKPDGTRTYEITSIKQASRPLCALYGRAVAAEFGPKAMKAVRQRMIDDKWSRRYINMQVGRIRRLFKWATEEELIPATVFHGLQAVAGLKRGRSKARELPSIKPVHDAHIDAVHPHVSDQVWAMIRLQRLTAARAGEIVRMRPIDLDTTGSVWLFRLEDHKTAHHGHERIIFLGPTAQEVVKPFLANRPVESFCFTPRDAIRDRADRATVHRRDGQLPTPRKTLRTVKDRYTTASYRRAIHRACKVAGIPHWTPLQLRHSAATEVRKAFGLEAAQQVLGHKHAAVSEVYAEVGREKALAVIAKIG